MFVVHEWYVRLSRCICMGYIGMADPGRGTILSKVRDTQARRLGVYQ